MVPRFIAVVPMNQSSKEKNGCCRGMQTKRRPVYARATFTAAVVTLDPCFANLTISADGIRLIPQHAPVIDLRRDHAELWLASARALQQSEPPPHGVHGNDHCQN